MHSQQPLSATRRISPILNPYFDSLPTWGALLNSDIIEYRLIIEALHSLIPETPDNIKIAPMFGNKFPEEISTLILLPLTATEKLALYKTQPSLLVLCKPYFHYILYDDSVDKSILGQQLHSTILRSGFRYMVRILALFYEYYLYDEPNPRALALHSWVLVPLSKMTEMTDEEISRIPFEVLAITRYSNISCKIFCKMNTKKLKILILDNYPLTSSSSSRTESLCQILPQLPRLQILTSIFTQQSWDQNEWIRYSKNHTNLEVYIPFRFEKIEDWTPLSSFITSDIFLKDFIMKRKDWIKECRKKFEESAYNSKINCFIYGNSGYRKIFFRIYLTNNPKKLEIIDEFLCNIYGQRQIRISTIHSDTLHLVLEKISRIRNKPKPIKIETTLQKLSNEFSSVTQTLLNLFSS